MLKFIYLYLFIAGTIFGQNIELAERNGRFYYKGELYTGEVRRERYFIRRFTDEITLYERGLPTAKKRLVYEEKMMGLTGRYAKDLVAGEYTWDFDREVIKYKGYVKGMLVTEGYYSYELKKIGIWKKYLGGTLLIEEFNHDLLNENNSKSNEVFRKISEEEMKEIKLMHPYKESFQVFNSEGEIVKLDEDFDLNNFTGTMEKKINGNIIDISRYRDGFCYEITSYYYNGGLKFQMVLNKRSFGRGYRGYQREYYYNGNIEEEVTVTAGRGYTGPLAAFKSSFNPTGNGRRSVGMHDTISYSGPFKQYYSNGQLMVQGENYNGSQDMEKLTIYDIDGQRIFLNE